MPLGGVATPLFAPLAKLMARAKFIPELFSWHVADEKVVGRLLRGTGSDIDPAGVALYRRVMKNPRHAAAALGMMANWDLRPLHRDLPLLAAPLLLIVGENDRTIPPADAKRLAAMLPGARVASLPGLGHLAHEERPEQVADVIVDYFAAVGAKAAA
jgi:magnesium chelatase accessory protein